MAGKYIINRSNYTLRRKHQMLNGNASVYERDFMTAGTFSAWDGETFPVSENGFKFTLNSNLDTRKRQKLSEWEKPSSCINTTQKGEEYWTLGCISDVDSNNTTDTIVTKPNKHNLLDYAYYGSMYDLITSTISKIVSEYPAELYVESSNHAGSLIQDYVSTIYRWNSKTQKVESADTVKTEFKDYVHISNPLGINLYTLSIPSGNTVSELRYFQVNANKYSVKQTNYEPVCATCSGLIITEKDCPGINGFYYGSVIINDTITVHMFRINGTIEYFCSFVYSGTRITPDEENIDNYFSGLSDIEKLFLNRDTNPVYKMTIDYPYETEDGIKTYKRNLNWPVLYGWNLMTDSALYDRYVKDLLDLADFYDEYYTDVLWRCMTHESIKNMDHTFSNPKKNEDNDDYRIGTGKIKGLFRAYGRLYDEIKRSADNISYVNRVTTDGDNNLPDYFISDSLENSGFEVYDSTKTLSRDTEVYNLYGGSSEAYTAYKANLTFMRNLRLVSKNVISKKGTRDSIESLLGLFGMKSKDFYDNEVLTNAASGQVRETSEGYDYIVSETVYVMKPKKNNSADVGKLIGMDDEAGIEKFNKMKYNYADGDYDGEPLQGLPLAELVVGNNRCLIPWFTNDGSIDGGLYFQSRGGWLGTSDFMPYESDEYISGNTFSADTLYRESINYVMTVGTIGELSEIYDGKLNNSGYTYVYVSDVDDYDDHYGAAGEGYYPSNYFKLAKGSDSESYGEGGWLNISPDSEEIKYLESIINDSKGNNPHTGFGVYDDGRDYVAHFFQLMKYSIDNDNFQDYAYKCDGCLIDGIAEAGFDIDGQSGKTESCSGHTSGVTSLGSTDNMKCWFFNDDVLKPIKRLDKMTQYLDGTGSTVAWLSGCSKQEMYGETYEVSGTQYSPATGSYVNEDKLIYKGCKFTPYNYEEVDKKSAVICSDVMASYSVMNSKLITVTFNYEKGEKDEFVKFVTNCVMPYLTQVIPSTAILKIKFAQK